MVVPGDLFGVIPLWVAVYIAAFIGGNAANYALYVRFIKPILLGHKNEKRFDQPLKRLWGVVLVVFGQRRVLMSLSWKWRDLAGIGHAIIFYGFISMVFSYALFIFLDSINPKISGYVLGPAGLKVFFWWLDILSVAVLASLIWAAYRRWGRTPKRLSTLKSREAAIILLAIGSLMLLHQLTEISSVAADLRGHEQGIVIEHLEGARTPAISASTPVAGNIGQALASAGISFDAANTLHGFFYWLHLLLVLGFGVYIAFSKHMHIMASPLNTFFRSLTPRGRLIPIANLTEAESWGATKPYEFSWKELLDGYACAVCGRCTFNCPANISGKPLSPMNLIEHMKENLLEQAPALVKVQASKTSDAKAKAEAMQKVAEKHPIFNEHFTEEWVWNCVTCSACEQECPVMVEHIDSIVDMRRYLVMTEAKMPPQVQQTLQSIETRGHPWRGTQATRTDWAKGLPVKTIAEAGDASKIEVLFWVGCTPALEQRSQATARAMARVMERAGVKYAILGVEESCNGDPARRLGHEYLYDMLARQNIETMTKYQVKKIVTTCPHCFNTLRNEYPDFGGTFEVEHYATFVNRLISEGKLKLAKPINASLTYHDSCYLGRYNNVYDEPRQLIQAIPGVKLEEVPLRNRERGFCCGAGGGHMWVEDSSGHHINHLRTEQALANKSGIIGVSCPFCLQMFKEGIESKGKKDEVKAMDVIELVAESMGE
ncbi:MAG: 4Fe-4S dicluster domain-containing protein [Chloroflexi bacterium]|nr:4Fe-4S dicluster domain-containing protein [Chloroflexota bacterium]